MHWLGNLQADYMYTNGVAGNRFFNHLKKKNNFLANKCPECKKVLFPPRLYCEDCFVEIPDKGWFEVPARGTIRNFTVVAIDARGDKLPQPKVLALIEIDKTDGALLGIIKTKSLNTDLTGKRVKAVLKPKSKREGTLKDILYFE